MRGPDAGSRLTSDADGLLTVDVPPLTLLVLRGAPAVGVDDAPPHRVYWDSVAHPDGATVEIIATVDDGSGRLRSDLRTVTLGTRDR